MACHYCITSNTDIIDAEFVDLTAQKERARITSNRIGTSLVILMAAAGFLFWPMMILWLTGEDISVNMAESLGEGHILFSVLHVALWAITAIISGFIGIALFPYKHAE